MALYMLTSHRKMLYLNHNTQHHHTLGIRAASEAVTKQQSNDLSELKEMIRENKDQLAEYQIALSTIVDKVYVVQASQRDLWIY